MLQIKPVHFLNVVWQEIGNTCLNRDSLYRKFFLPQLIFLLHIVSIRRLYFALPDIFFETNYANS